MLGALRDLATEALIFDSLHPAFIFQEEIVQKRAVSPLGIEGTEGFAGSPLGV